MLTPADIEKLSKSGAFTSWAAPGVLTPRRRFLATELVIRALETPWRARNYVDVRGQTVSLSASDAEGQRARIRDVIAVWQRGDPMIARDQIKPFTPPPACDGLWELRSADAPPGVRVLGFFPLRNIFVAVGIYPRDKLGQRGSAEWNTAIGYAAAQGASWFKSGPPITWQAAAAFKSSDLTRICDDF